MTKNDKTAPPHAIAFCVTNAALNMLRPVSTTSVEKSILSLFYCFFFALASILTARFNRRSIKSIYLFVLCFKTKNTPIYEKKKFSKAQEGSEKTIRSSRQRMLFSTLVVETGL